MRKRSEVLMTAFIRLTAVATTVSLAALVGCARQSRLPLWPGTPQATCTLYAREIVLRRDARDPKLGVQLLRVEPDGAAVIHVDRTGETLSAKPGEYFLGDYHAPHNVRTFGEHGLHVATSDTVMQTAVLVRAWSE